MLIALLFSLLFAGTSGSPGNFFLVPDIKKEVKKSVTDPEREEELLLLIKAMGKEIKAFQKFNKSYLKQVPTINADRNADRADIERLFNESYEERKALQEKMVDGTLRFQELCTEEEWNAIIDIAFQPSEKQQRKLDKAAMKALSADRKPIEKIREEIESGIAEQGRRDQALNAFSTFETNMNQLLDHIRETDTEHNETLRKYGVTCDELSAVYAEQNQIRDQVYKTFIDMHFEMIQATTEAEWKAISKTVKKIFS